MGETSQNSDVYAARGSISQQAKLEWRRFAADSMLAISGITLVTIVIALAHLYPRLPSIVLIYLLMIIVLASTRGIYAATLAALLASFSFRFFLGTLSDMFSFNEFDDWLDLVVFLSTAIIVGQMTAALRRHAERARLREYETRLLSEHAQEYAALQERLYLARELHDSISQALYGINLGAYTALEALNSNPDEAIAPLGYVIDMAEAGLAEMRDLIFELRPASLATDGIIAALTNQVAILRTRYKLLVDAQLDEEPDLALANKQALYRIAQESLHNIVKHACASVVTLRLIRQNDELILEICDDGKGFDPTQSFPGHLGLQSIRERAAWLGGTCSIESAPSQGTQLCVRIPTHDEPGSTTEEDRRH